MIIPSVWTVIARQFGGTVWRPSDNPVMTIADARRLTKTGHLLMANRPVVTGTSRHVELVVKAPIAPPRRR